MPRPEAGPFLGRLRSGEEGRRLSGGVKQREGEVRERQGTDLGGFTGSAAFLCLRSGSHERFTAEEGLVGLRL